MACRQRIMVGAGLLASVAVIAACGGESTRTDDVRGGEHAGDSGREATAGSDGSPSSAGSAGSESGSSGSTASGGTPSNGGGGAPPNGGGGTSPNGEGGTPSNEGGTPSNSGSGSGGVPFSDALIDGDPELCPPRVVRPGTSCEVAELTCTYADGLFGGSANGLPIACQCGTNETGEPAWVCLVPERSDEGCPRDETLEPGCMLGMSCLYALSHAYALCTCQDELSPPEGGGEGGFGGETSSSPETYWLCAV